MNNKVIKSFISLTLLLSVAFLFGETAKAETVKQFNDKEIFVSFSALPFNLNNFYPGKETETKTITINNEEDFNINVSIGANSALSDLKLAQVLIFQIEEKTIPLFDLLQSNVDLGTIDADKEKDYDLRIKFDPSAGNQYQNLSIEFNLVITVTEIDTEDDNNGGDEGGGDNGGDEEEVPIITTTSSGGGDSFLQPLKVSNEQVILDRGDPETVIITWLSNKEATSKVLYDTESRSLSTNPPDYGYAYYTEEKDDKITFHEVELTNLDPDTTYYYRVVSRISSATIGNEFDFTTYSIEEDDEDQDQEVKGDKEEAGEDEQENGEQEVKGDKITGETEEQEPGEESRGNDLDDSTTEREGFFDSPDNSDISQEVAGIKVDQEDDEEEQQQQQQEEDSETEALQPGQEDFQEKIVSTSQKTSIKKIFSDWWPLGLLLLALAFWFFFIYRRREEEDGQKNKTK